MKVLIAEPIEICRFALKTMISERFSDASIIEASSISQLKQLFYTEKPDFLLIEPTQFLESDHAIMLYLLQSLPVASILIITNHDDKNYYLTLPSSEKLNFLMKEYSVTEQKTVIHNFLTQQSSSEPVLDPATVTNTPTIRAFDTLTDRETEILSLISTGKTSRDIAGILFISPHTAQRHRKNILKKLNLKGTAELVRFYLDKMN